ncbi:hypothetical protein BSKO_11983 [Bryopsis sp. KO-2023]|nr:hypothetical protein BSKO_11983 [Bryopsis sp. KO-2023]
MTSIVHCMEQFLGCRNLNALVKTVAKGILKQLDTKFHVILACRIALMRSDAQAALIFEDETITHHRRSSSSAAYRMTNGIIQFPKTQSFGPQDLASVDSRRRINQNDVKDLESDFLGHKTLLKDTILGEALRSKVSKCINDVTSYCQVLDVHQFRSQPEPKPRSSLSKMISATTASGLPLPQSQLTRIESPSSHQKARVRSEADGETVSNVWSIDGVDDLYRPRRKSMSINVAKDVSAHHLGPMNYNKFKIGAECQVRGIWDRLRENSTLAYDAIVDRPEDLMRLEVTEEIGSGGYGHVFRGTWNGLEVAVKVISIQDDNRSLIRQAMEVAIMSTVAHPYILQGLTAFTDVVRVDDGDKMRFVQPDVLAKPEVASEPRYCLICMEFCEKGSLVDAIQSGAFKTLVKGGYGSSIPSLFPIYQTLLEVAVALRLLHSMKLVHCDIKPDNILLKSSSSDPRGFQTRLSDFGTMKISEGPGLGVDTGVGTDEEHRRAVEGTVTHLPPEILNGCGAIGDHIDIYAFGIVMWELYVSMPVYLGLSKEQIVHRVVSERLRPLWPVDTPERYKILAEACWAEEIGERPKAEDIVYILNSLVTREGNTYNRWKSEAPAVEVQPRASKGFNMHSTWCKEKYPLHIL